MKKVLSVLLAFALVFTGLAPIIALAVRVSAPVVYVGGWNQIIYSDKNDIESTTYFTGDLPEEAVDTISGSLRRELVQAISGTWQPYLDGYYEAALPYYSEIILDDEGLPINNTGYDCLKEETLVDKAVNNRYGLHDYTFVYDWRLDPCANAEDLNDYIDAVLAVTGASKVDIVAVGIGVSTVLAYLAAYGSDKISELVLQNAALDGSDVYGAYFTNDITMEREEVSVFVAEARRNVKLLQTIKSFVPAETWDQNLSVNITRDVYSNLYKDTFSRIARTVYGTMPGVWSLIGDEYFQDAIDTVFGPDFEAASEYMVLIGKITNYHNNVQVRTKELLEEAMANGVNVYNVVNYGFHMVPVNEHSNVTSDVYVSVPAATLGATCAHYGDALAEDYVPADEAYVSPDREIDASTGFIPANTWFVKNLENGEAPAVVDDLIIAILNFNGYTTVEDLADYPQYLFCSNDRKDLSAITEEGGSDYEDTQEENEQSSRITIGSLFEMVKRFITYVTNLVRQLITFGQSKPITTVVEEELNNTTGPAEGTQP